MAFPRTTTRTRSSAPLHALLKTHKMVLYQHYSKSSTIHSIWLLQVITVTHDMVFQSWPLLHSSIYLLP
jgi:hypothetical protein